MRRDATGWEMAYNLTTAAAAAGINKTTVLRAIRGGRISAQRSETGEWHIEPAEFHRVYAPLPAGQPIGPVAEQRDAMADTLVAELRSVIADLRSDRDHWRNNADHWRAQAQLALPKPEEAKASRWSWLRLAS